MKPTEVLESPQTVTGVVTSATQKEIPSKNGPFEIVELLIAPDPDCPITQEIPESARMSVGYPVSTLNVNRPLGQIAEQVGWDGESDFDPEDFVGAQVLCQAIHDGTYWNIARNSVQLKLP